MDYKRKSKIQMWYKVQELTEQGLNKSQIKRETGLDRATIRNYQQMDEDTFHAWIKNKKNLPQKLSRYRGYVKDLLDKTPYLSSAQVEDRLKENHNDLPQVHSKTVFNFVQTLREEYNIPKPSIQENRSFEKLPEPPYGKEAQVDFGRTWMQDKDKKRKEVYFFVMVLSRSRYKFVCFTDKPFTAKSAVDAHHLAFEYFMGVSREIIYDQDRVFIHNENLGDYMLTKEFSAFCKSQSFKAVFCRKADPQSKGKVENVVKYVKQNFLRGREYVNLDALNRQALEWLGRTANAKKHSSTGLVPKEEWEHEKPHLLAVRQKHVREESKAYKVRKDNTVCFKSNYYSLPLDTYKDSDSCILLAVKQKELHFYTLEKMFICSHELNPGRGQTIRNTDHRREKSKTLETYHKQVLVLFGQSELAENYLQVLRKEKYRYYRDTLQYILRKHNDYQPDTIRESLLFCIENKVYNAKGLIEVLNKNQKEKEERAAGALPKALSGPTGFQPDAMTAYEGIEKSDINTYENIINNI
jgi:transposase